jgi:hypothetical protein
MVSNWHDYWDKLPGGGLATYTASMLVAPMAPQFLKEGTPATFLLFSRGRRRPLKAWSGQLLEIAHDPRSQRIAFRVKIRRAIPFPRKYAKLPDGWYVEDLETEVASTGFW